MKIKPKLYLNANPQTMDEGSLSYARNMKLDDDGVLTNDFGFESINDLRTIDIVGHIVGLDNIIYIFGKDIYDNPNNRKCKIIEYNELTKEINYINSGWNYSEGIITGYVSTNISGEKILTIAEYLNDEINIPIKHINLSYCKSDDDESIYCQAPLNPIANLKLQDTYIKSIPNGVYVFFIRYKIRENNYTKWMLCSNPIFGGTSEKINTLQGGVQNINIHKDSAKSFIFEISYATRDIVDNYEEFQLGFILTHDESTNARIWKSFSMDTTTIYFDYEDIKECNIDDFTNDIYEIYNVKNVTNFRNQLYISNYKESDFNPNNINDILNNITLSVRHYQNNNINYKSLKINNEELNYDNDLGYYDKINNTSITDVRNTLIQHSLFDFTITDLVKMSTTTKENCCTFSLKWDSGSDPDLMTIVNIHNVLQAGAIFGDDYNVELGNGRKGVILEGTTKFADGRIISFLKRDTDNPHPWDELGLTFIYGSGVGLDIIPNTSKEDTYLINSATRQRYNEPIPIITSDGTVTGNSIPAGSYWNAKNSGFTTTSKAFIDNNIKEEIKNKRKGILCYLELTSGAKVYKINYTANMDESDYAGMTAGNVLPDGNDFTAAFESSMTEELKILIKNNAIQYLKNNIIGFDEDGVPVVSIDGDVIHINSINFVIKNFEFDVDSKDVDTSDGKYYKDYSIKLTTTNYNAMCYFSIKNDLIESVDNASEYNQASTLMPLSTYKAYIHLVDKFGVVTNGYELQTLTTNQFICKDTSRFDIAYKIDTNMLNTDRYDYKAFFISLVNVGDIILEGFGYDKINGNHILNFIELDTMLYNINNDITIVDENNNTIATNANYYSSSVSNPNDAFGNCGYVSWKNNESYYDKKLFIKIHREITDKPKRLIKCSEYISLTNGINQITTLSNPYYQSYFCIIKKPSFKLAYNCYVSGSDIYTINRENVLKLDEFDHPIQVQNSKSYIIRSNFNVNYLSLTEDVTDRIFSVGSGTPKIRQVGKVLQSATLSYIYELKSMYKSFENKYFRPYTEYTKTIFDNTIRVSDVLSDETFNNSVFTFYPSDYYNIPTDRGIIVKLFSISNIIYAHTKSSLYKFDGNQTLLSNDTDIKLKESDPFDKGISQIFDSQYGYAGIDNKEAGCVSYEFYIFYDKTSNHIFAYHSNNLMLIDGTIYKFLKTTKPKKCRTLNDLFNNRVLLEFYECEHDEQFTISFNVKTKTIISLHDITLNNSFETKNNCYSYNGKCCKLFVNNFDISYGSYHSDNLDMWDVSTLKPISPENETIIDQNSNLKNIFGDATRTLNVFAKSNVEINNSPFGISVVLFSKNNIENINSVSISADAVLRYIENTNANYYITYYTHMQNRYICPLISMNVKTDCCESNLIEFEENETDRWHPNELVRYKNIKQDKNTWTTNFIRNINNATNVYEYPNEDIRTINNDNNSLVYGSWFIVNLVLNYEYVSKIEGITINNNVY